MGAEQRALFRETQAVMSLLEGFSDYVMDEVGRELVPDVERISARFHERRSGGPRSSGRCSATGMDLKLEQYAKGERFVRAIAEARGPGALARALGGPETLPRTGRSTTPIAGSHACSRGARVPRRPGDDRRGPARGPGGVPRHRAQPDPVGPLPRATSSESALPPPAPGIVKLSLEGLADGPLDDVEVLLRGWLGPMRSIGC